MNKYIIVKALLLVTLLLFLMSCGEKETTEPETKVGNFKVNDDKAPNSSQRGASVSIDGSGNSIVAWSDDRNVYKNVYAQRYSSSGQATGVNFRVDDGPIAPDHAGCSVAMDGSGNAVIVWLDKRNLLNDIYAQRYSNNGSAGGSNFKVNENPGNSGNSGPCVAIGSSGTTVIVWADARNGNSDIYAQYYNSSGATIGGNILVADSANIGQSSPAVSVDGLGNVMIAWEDSRNGLDNFDIYAQRLSSSGTKIGKNFRVNSDGGNVEQIQPSVSTDLNGNSVIAWQDSRSGYPDVYAQRYDNAGSAVGANFKVNGATSGTTHYAPSVSMNGTGNFVVAWYGYPNGNADILAQRYSNSGSAVGSNFRVNDDPAGSGKNHFYPAVALDASGNFIIAWQDYRNGSWDIYAQRYDANGTPL